MKPGSIPIEANEFSLGHSTTDPFGVANGLENPTLTTSADWEINTKIKKLLGGLFSF